MPESAPAVRWFRPIIALLLLVGVGGCRTVEPTDPPAHQSPWVHPRVDHYVGTPLSGPIDAPVPPTSGAPWVANVVFISMDELSSTLLDPLGEHAELITTDGVEDPILATPQQCRGARAAALDSGSSFLAEFHRTTPPRRRATIASLRHALLPGTTSFVLHGAEHSDQRFSVLVHRSSKSVELAFSVQNDGSEEVISLRGEEWVDRGVLVPSPFVENCAILAIVEVRPSDEGEVPGDLAEVGYSEHIESDLGTARLTTADPLRTPGPMDPKARRRALALLGSDGGASLAAEIALVAEDSLVEKIAADAFDGGWVIDDPELGWKLERATLRTLVALLEEETLATDLEGLLAIRLGELARHPSPLRPLIEAATCIADFDRELVRENRIFLEDSSPAARVRAFDWLRSRGEEFGQYDPLGSPKDRRAALDTVESSTEPAEGVAP